jgi:A/G-specific adenine glycosylase
VRARVLRWYRRHRRDLPWRRTRDPYAIWVAETMLQQTRSETVQRYFARFLGRFPTVAALARARESAVLTLWSGLGYYSRARHLHRAARRIVAAHAGSVPADPEALRALPGVGRYTAGAVASIAFGRAEPVLDGNVARVLARWFGVRGDPLTSAVQAALWKLAAALVSSRAAGEWNQALMELGATLCTTRRPGCGRCPVRSECAARREGAIDAIPGRTRRPATRRVRRAALVVERRFRVLLLRRDTGRLLRGLWEFPAIDAREHECDEGAARRLLVELGDPGGSLRSQGRILHTIMNRRIETAVFRARLEGNVARGLRAARWFRPDELAHVPLSAAGMRIARLLGLTPGFPDESRARPVPRLGVCGGR